MEITIRLTPNAATDRIGRVEIGADGKAYVTARVRAVPEKGQANAALERLLAKDFGLPKTAVRLRSGHTARIKTIAINADEATARRIADRLKMNGEG